MYMGATDIIAAHDGYAGARPPARGSVYAITRSRDHALETIVIDAMAERMFRPERLRALLANLLDNSASGVRERQAHLKVLRTERTRVEALSRIWSTSSSKASPARVTPTSLRGSIAAATPQRAADQAESR